MAIWVFQMMFPKIGIPPLRPLPESSMLINIIMAYGFPGTLFFLDYALLIANPVTQANPAAIKPAFSPFLLPSKHCKQIQFATRPGQCCSTGALGVVAIRSVVGNSVVASLIS